MTSHNLTVNCPSTNELLQLSNGGSLTLPRNFIYSAKSMTPDESLPTKQTVVFLNFICDFNATVLLRFFIIEHSVQEICIIPVFTENKIFKK